MVTPQASRPPERGRRRAAGMRATAFAITAIASTLHAAPVTAQLHAGAAAVEITPRLCENAAPDAGPAPFNELGDCFRWIHLAGFSPFVPLRSDNRLATGIHDPLWSRALAIRGSNGHTVVIVSTDLPGLGRKHTGRVRRRVERTLGVPATHVIIQSTHTHSAPDASGYWSTLVPGRNARYTEKVREHIYQSIDLAIRRLRPATMSLATTTHVSCRDPTTGVLKRDPQCRLPDINNEFDDSAAAYDEFLMQRDQRDPIVRNTRIVAAGFDAVATGAPIATFVNWHNHPDTLGSANRLVSSDYPHYLRQFLEERRGGVAVYVVGTLGNQIGGLRGTPVPLWSEAGERVVEVGDDGVPAPVLVRDGWDKIRSTGYEVADAAARALETAAATTAVTVSVHTTALDTPIDNVIHLLATWSVWNDGASPEDRPRYSWPRCWGPLGCVRAEVSLLRIGELSLLTAPGEIDPAYFLGRAASTADYGERWGTWHFPAMPGVDRIMPGTHHAVVGSAQDYLSYMIPRPDYVGWWNGDHPNHYEDFVTIGRRFGDDVGRAWLELLAEAGQIASER